MDSLDAAKLQALLDTLVESGVEEFEGYGIHVRFTAGLFTSDKEVREAPAPVQMEPPPRNLWEMPELWPGGKPPTFPKK